MEKRGILIFAQIDNVTGEILGYAVERLIEIGAYNVQLIPTITKKNRPGNILIIDTNQKNEQDIADFLVRELKVSGYHRLSTTHVFFEVSFLEKTINVLCNGKSRNFKCRFKVIGDPSEPISVDVEHDFLVMLQRIINEMSDDYKSLDELRNEIEKSFQVSTDVITLKI